MTGQTAKKIINEAMIKFCNQVVDANTSYFEKALNEVEQLEVDSEIADAIKWTIEHHGFDTISNDNTDLEELLSYYREHSK